MVNQPLAPSSVAPGGPGFALTVNGSGFVSGAVVHWNGIALPTTFVSASKLKAGVGANRVRFAGTVNVTVTNPGPGGGVSNTVFFTITKASATVTFAASVVAVGVDPESLVAGDFNGDGKTDLAVFNLNQPDSGCYVNFNGVGTVQTLLGNGHGGFAAGSSACLPDEIATTGIANLVAGDFNNDGKMDLGAAFRAKFGFGIQILMNDGTGKFALGTEIGEFDGMEQPIVGDFNGDGQLDLAVPDDFVAAAKSRHPAAFFGIEEFAGDGAGGFNFVSDFGFLSASTLATGDFNRDGILDLAVGGTTGQGLILLGIPGGSFAAASTQPTVTLVHPVVGDFNGDGILDIADGGGSCSLSMLLGNGDGTFRLVAAAPESVQGSDSMSVADLNGDGKLDVVMIGGSGVLTCLGNGDGTFRVGSDTAVGNGPTQLTIGDFNRDGRLDVAVTNSADNTVSILMQSAAATLSSSSLTFGTVTVGQSSSPQHVTLTNSGSAVFRLSGIATSGDFAQVNDCKSILRIGQTCSLSVEFKPTATGLRTGSIAIKDNAGGSPQVIQLSGTGASQ
jgi:hypothetical protein